MIMQPEHPAASAFGRSCPRVWCRGCKPGHTNFVIAEVVSDFVQEGLAVLALRVRRPRVCQVTDQQTA